MKKNFITSKDLNLVFGSDLKVLNITGAEIDSRNIKRGNIFFAIDGKKNNGHDFLKDYRNHGNLHIAVTNSKGFVVEYDMEGIHRDRTLGKSYTFSITLLKSESQNLNHQTLLIPSFY